MARVNVDSQALTDARFAVLAGLMGSDDPDLALGRMIRVWMQCLERETYVLTQSVIVALFRGALDAPIWLVSAELAEPVENGYRIKGTQGRIEYLAEQRARSRRNGSLGGRPAATYRNTGSKPSRLGKITPLTPALTPALTLKETPLPPELDSPQFRESWTAWKAHRQEIGKRLKPTTVSRQLKALAAMGEGRAVACIEHTITKGWTGLREPDAIGTNGKPTVAAAVAAARAKSEELDRQRLAEANS